MSFNGVSAFVPKSQPSRMKRIEDFLVDPKFVQWVYHPTADLDAYWRAWREAHPEQLSDLKLARELLLRMRYKEPVPRPGAKQRILNNIMQRREIIPAARHERYLRPKTSLWERISQWQRIAAIFLVTLLLAWLAFPHHSHRPAGPVAEEIPVLRKTTAPGEKLQVTLPDGSRIYLNAVSSLEFPEQFDALERRVVLSGEGYFEVEHDSLRPFRVVSNGTVTTALGTSFNINGKSADDVRISLLTGKVKVKTTADSEHVFLDPGQELHFDREREVISVKEFSSGEVTAWKDGRIVFRDASLPEVVKVLEEWYGVNIHLENQRALEWKYSGEYSRQTLEDVLNSLSYVQKFDYTINGKNVAFKF